MKEINYIQKLKSFYVNSNDISELPPCSVDHDIDYIVERISKNKGVYTVLITLSLYKVCHPEQDIRQHKIELPNGFSGRSFDTKFVTPTLKELGLPAMAESGWLTRSLEQAYSYDFNFNGKITPKELKDSFLNTVAEIQKGKSNAEYVLKKLLNGGIQFQHKNKININRIEDNGISIHIIVDLLKVHFEEKYGTHGGSKLPVLAFYAIYSLLIKELGRFSDCTLAPLGSHTASDKTSKSGGDIEILKNDRIFEALEIKLDKSPTAHMLRVAYDKINQFGISRYYILSGVDVIESERENINSIINNVKEEHGCQIIVNGLYASLKYYLRLISEPQNFLNRYIELVEDDKELQSAHKEKLQQLLQEYHLI